MPVSVQFLQRTSNVKLLNLCNNFMQVMDHYYDYSDNNYLFNPIQQEWLFKSSLLQPQNSDMKYLKKAS